MMGSRWRDERADGKKVTLEKMEVCAKVEYKVRCRELEKINRTRNY